MTDGDLFVMGHMADSEEGEMGDLEMEDEVIWDRGEQKFFGTIFSCREPVLSNPNSCFYYFSMSFLIVD